MTDSRLFTPLRRSRFLTWGGWRWLFIVVLTAQLLIATLHHHDPAKEHVDDCVACILAAQVSGGALPTLPVFVAAVLAAFLLARCPRYIFRAQSRHHLLPPSQAPPVFC